MSNIKQGGGETSLADLCLSTASLYQINPTKVDGALMARLASLLIASEQQPGGPYLGPAKTPDLLTNLAVGYVFATFKKPLPNVTRFIQRQRQSANHSPAIKTLLQKYDDLVTADSPRPHVPSSVEHTAIFSAARHQLNHLAPPEKTTALSFLDTIRQADKSHEIALLPSFFNSSLTKQSLSMPLQELGLANIYCWIAYSIYDKLLDDEPAAHLLSVANIAMRKSLKIYTNLAPSTDLLQNTIEHTFLNMDHANAWELANARFKRAGENLTIPHLPRYDRYQILADRSAGHILGPLAIAILCDVSSESFHHIKKGLRHYLIARQLSDDIHDWKEDFNAGHASSTVTYLLQQLHIGPGTYSFTTLLDAMQTHFWKASMEKFTAIIVRHLQHSRRYLLRSGILEKGAPLFALHDQLENTAQMSLAQYRSSRSFLETYLRYGK